MVVTEIMNVTMPNITDFEYVTIEKNELDLIINNLKLNCCKYIRPSIKDGRLNFHLGKDEQIRYDINNFNNLNDKYNCRTIDGCFARNRILLRYNIGNDMLYITIYPS
jgi:hypothetical protein